MAAGALNLASPEVKIHLDSSESSDPVDVEQKALHETNSLVEEFMLLANTSVAKKTQESFPQTSVLRYTFPVCCTHFLSTSQTTSAAATYKFREIARYLAKAKGTQTRRFQLGCIGRFP